MTTKRWNERVRTISVVSGESKTQQSHKATVDVNNIIARFDRTGQLPPHMHEPQYGDVTMMNGNLQEVLDRANMTIEEADSWITDYNEAKKLVEEETASLTDQPKQAEGAQTDDSQ